MRRIKLTVNKPGIRLDRYVSQQCELSRAHAQKLIRDGYITVNAQTAKASLRLAVGDRVMVNLPPPTPNELTPEKIPLKIVYEDSDLLVVDKPAGLAVHPSPGHPSHTLVNAILAHCPALGGIEGSVRPGIVHRLDKNTSGLMIVAKSDAAQINLSRQFKERSVVKRYLALVLGQLTPERGAIEAGVGRSSRDRKRMAVVSMGRDARTQYKVLQYIDDHTLIEVTPETGRTHQIRVHFSAIGYPVFGDSTYGKASSLLGRHFLHAHYLGFRLPSNGEFAEFSSELPQELRDTLERISRVS